MKDMPEVTHDGPADQPLEFVIAPHADPVVTITLPNVSGFILPAEDWPDFCAMLAEWRAKRDAQ